MSIIALIDIGKTNSKLSLIDSNTGERTFTAARANRIVRNDLGAQLDLFAIEEWLVRTLAAAPDVGVVSAIVPVAHGAAAVLLDKHHDVIAACDYEDAQFDSVADAYRERRDGFMKTYSPDLSLGLNLGRQLFFLQTKHADVFARVTHALLYPQYWAWRCCGVIASEVSSLGCHTDLWLPGECAYSSLAIDQNWADLFPPIQFAGDTLGTVTPAFAAATGLPLSCRVVCGVHDSNASYLKVLLGREDEGFTIVSSGTWTIAMSNGGELAMLQEQRDMLANVDVFGSAVPTARYMGGREYELIAGTREDADLTAIARSIETGAMALPAFVGSGPFASRHGSVIGLQDAGRGGSAAVATLYSVLMTDALIESLGFQQNVFIDGPFARNPFFNRLLASCDRSRRVLVSSAAELAGVCFLAGAQVQPCEPSEPAQPLDISGFDHYRARWRELTAKEPST